MFWCLMYVKSIKACMWPKLSYVLQAGLWSKKEYSALREKLAKPVPSPTMVVNDSGGYVTIDSATRSAVESSQSTTDRCVKRFIGRVHGMTESIFPWFNILADRVSSTSPRVRAGHRCRRTWTASSTPGCSWIFPTGAWPSTPSFHGFFCNTRAFLMGFGILRRNCVWNFWKSPEWGAIIVITGMVADVKQALEEIRSVSNGEAFGEVHMALCYPGKVSLYLVGNWIN